MILIYVEETEINTKRYKDYGLLTTTLCQKFNDALLRRSTGDAMKHTLVRATSVYLNGILN